MRNTLILIALLAATVSVKAQYHIKAECFGTSDYAGDQYYNISYTIDNWKTQASLMNTFDLGIEDFEVAYQDKLFNNKDECISFAKHFKTYRNCLDFNNKVFAKYKSLVSYRRLHPIKKPKPIEQKRECCKTINIY